jgi:arabinofuranosyltransferase
MFIRRIRPEVLIAAVALAIAAWWLSVRMRFPFDDTYITFRYATNLAHGFGIVWNAGGAHTEGYTNFLLVLLLAPFSAMGWELVAVSQAIGVLAVTISAIALFRVSGMGFRVSEHNNALGSRSPIPDLRWFVVALFLLDPFVWMNAYSGLETSLFTMWLLLALWAVGRGRPAYAFALATLATLTRPEGALMGMILLIVGIVSNRGITNSRDAIRSFLLAFVLPLLVYAGWKLWYFGNLLPNSFYIKVAQAGGSTFLPGRGTIRIFYEGVWYLLPFACIAAWKRRKNATLQIVTGWCVLLTVFYLFADLLQPQYGRFTNSIEVLLMIPAGIGVGLLWQYVRYPRTMVTLLIAFQLYWSFSHRHGRSIIEDAHPYERTYARIASVFRAIPHHEEITFAWSDAGILPYFSGMQHIDMVGLNTTMIARAHTTEEAVRIIAQSRPDMIMIPLRADSILEGRRQIFQGGHGLIGNGFGMLLAQPELSSYQSIATLPVAIYDLDLFADTTSPHYRDIVNTIVPLIGRDSDFEEPVQFIR